MGVFCAAWDFAQNPTTGSVGWFQKTNPPLRQQFQSIKLSRKISRLRVVELPDRIGSQRIGVERFPDSGGNQVRGSLENVSVTGPAREIEGEGAIDFCRSAGDQGIGIGRRKHRNVNHLSVGAAPAITDRAGESVRHIIGIKIDESPRVVG